MVELAPRSQSHFGLRVAYAVLAACAASLLCACASRDIDSYSGLDRTKYLGKDPYLIFPPDQMVDQMDIPFPSGRVSVDWGMSLVWLGDHYLLTADHNTTPGLPTQVWRIIAIQEVPLLKAGQIFAFGTCRDDGDPAPRVLAVAVYDGNQQWFDRIAAAWGYDPAHGEFRPYPTVKLTCYNPRYGLGLDSPAMPSTAPAAAVSHAPPH